MYLLFIHEIFATILHLFSILITYTSDQTHTLTLCYKIAFASRSYTLLQLSFTHR